MRYTPQRSLSTRKEAQSLCTPFRTYSAPFAVKKINNKNDEHLNSYQGKVTIAFGSKKIRVSFKNTTSTQYLEFPIHNYQPNTHANTRGATIVASLSMMYLGVRISSLPQVIFSFGCAPE